MNMWYPNKAQWRVIWVLAIIVGVVGVASIGRSAFWLIAMFFDAVILIWWLQKSGHE